MGWSTQERIDAIVKRTRGGGGEIVALLEDRLGLLRPRHQRDRDGREPISSDKKRLLPCAAYVDGQYGVDDLYVGVPVVIGAGGVEKIVEIELDDEAKAESRRSASTRSRNCWWRARGSTARWPKRMSYDLVVCEPAEPRPRERRQPFEHWFATSGRVVGRS